MSDTIAAIATAKAAAGIGIIRISGPEARAVASRVFRAASGQSLTQTAGYRARYGRVYDQDGDFDDAVALVYRAPKSYTGEDVVELSCHGGLFLVNRLLRAVLSSGARMAQPGEFTRRAFLNGKIDLTEAEAVMKLIQARGEGAARAALAAKDGALSKRIHAVRDALVETASWMAAWADYPEEDIPALDQEKLSEQLAHSLGQLQQLLDRFQSAKVLCDGVDTVIAGRPNVGKSTLMNLLSGRQSSIVTDVPGTTRDVVEETVQLNGILLRLSDTAGLRQTQDIVEQIGVERAQSRLESAELVLFVLDCSEPLLPEDLAWMQRLQGRPCVACINKTDLNCRIDIEKVKELLPHTVLLSAKEEEGVEQLSNAVSEVLGTADIDPSAAMLQTERQRDCVLRCTKELQEALDTLHSGMTLDAVSVCLDEALSALLELTGERVTQAVTDQVFHRFCVGK